MSTRGFFRRLSSAFALICLIATTPSPCKATDASQCTEQWGGIWNAEKERCEPATDARTACEKGGGKMAQAGRMGRFRCITPYADGGQPCTDSGQCKGRCLFEGDEQKRPLAQAAVGQCSRNDNPFGCFVEIRNGKLTDFLCVD